MKTHRIVWFALMASAGFTWAEPQGAQEVRALGRLNGEALACNQPALVDRIRSHIVYEAAKTREIGEIFENATNESFLEMGKEGRSCPDARSLAQKIDEGIAALRKAFPKP